MNKTCDKIFLLLYFMDHHIIDRKIHEVELTRKIKIDSPNVKCQ